MKSIFLFSLVLLSVNGYESVHSGYGEVTEESGYGSAKVSEEASGYGGSGYGDADPGYGGGYGGGYGEATEKIEKVPGKQICAPGKIFKDKCNICKCSPDGTQAACTKKECVDEPQGAYGKIEEATTEKQNCIPGAVFNIKCNICRCSQDGSGAVCTRKACPEEKEPTSAYGPKYETTTAKQICVPNEIFKNGCDDCKCSPDGAVAVCTKKPCPEATTEVSEVTEHYETTTVKQVCQPGQVFKIECNICKCASDGSKAVCSKQACKKTTTEPEVTTIKYETTTEKQICTPGKIFYDKCNLCKCSRDGTKAACTKKACPTPKPTTEAYETTTVKRICSPLKIWKIDDCNFCKCALDGASAACTDKKCLKEIIKEKQICEPGKLFKKDSCNICKCSLLGTKALCIQTKCSEEVAKQFCEPGKVFNDKCNVCKCSADGNDAICTKMPCPGKEEKIGYSTNPIARVCEPGQIFKDQCNVCRCAQDGTQAACTKMDCPDDENNSASSSESTPTTTLKFEIVTEKQICTPGEMFEDKCNMCKCSVDGTRAACTQKRCDNEPEYEEVKNETTTETSAEETTTKKQICTPGKIFYDKCNICKCSLDGTTSVCTEKACVEEVKQGSNGGYENTTAKQTCVPGKIFKDKCNICKCSTDGTEAVCTKKLCHLKSEGPNYN